MNKEMKIRCQVCGEWIPVRYIHNHVDWQHQANTEYHSYIMGLTVEEILENSKNNFQLRI